MDINDQIIIKLAEDSSSNKANIIAIKEEMVAMRSDTNNAYERVYDINATVNSINAKVACYSASIAGIVAIMMSALIGKML